MSILKNIIVFFLLFASTSIFGVAKSWVSGATWQTATWSPAGTPTSSDAVTISATTFTLDGTVNAASIAFSGLAATTLTITGTVNVSGIFDINSLDRNRTFTVNAGSSIVSVGTLVYPTQGTSTYNIGANGQLTIGTMLTLSTRDVMVLTGNATLTCNGGIVDAAGSITLSATSRVRVGVRYEVQSASVVLTAGSTIEFIAATTVIETGGGVNLTLSNVQLTSGLVTFSSPITVRGNWTNNGGSFTSGANTLTFSGTGNTIGGTTATTFNTIILANAANYTMNNSNSCTSLTFNNGNTTSSLTQSSGTVFTINGAVTINQPSNNTTRNWNINNGTVTVSGLISFLGGSASATRFQRITINNGILNANGGILFTTSLAAGKIILMSGGTTGTLNLKGALTVPAASSTLTAGTSSTFNYCDNVSAQTVNYFSAGAYNNLTFNNTNVSGATLSAAISATNVTGNVSVQTGTLSNGTFAIVGNAAKVFSVSNGATFRLTGTSAMPTGFGTTTLGTTSTCDFNGVGAQTIAAHNYGNLTCSNGVAARTLVSVGTIGIASVFTPGTNVYTVTGSTVNFNGTGAQTIPTFTFNNFTTSIGGTKTLGGAITVNNDLTISSPSVLDASPSNFAITVRHNWLNNSSFTYRQGTVSFSGSTAQSIGGSSTNTFYNLSVTPTVTGINVSANTSTDIINDLTFNASPGTLTFTTNNNVTLKSGSGQTARVASITNPTGLTVSGNMNIERFAPGGTTGWTIMGASGISGLSFSSWDPYMYITCAACPDGYNVGGSDFGSIQSYSETVGNLFDDTLRYTEIPSIATPITVGQGYWVYLGDGPTTTNNITLLSSGSIVKGNVNFPLTVTGGASADHGWNLLANPYPSPISWDLLRNANASVDAEIQVYNPDFGTHASYSGGVGTNGLSSTGAIPMGQAFYVHASAATTLNATEAIKSNTQSDLLRLTSNNSVLTSGLAQTVVHLTINGGSSALHDETALHFNTNATTGWDTEWDAHKMAGFDYTSVNISSLSAGEQYSINGLPALNGSVSIPLLVKTGTSGNYTLSSNDLTNLPAGACVQLTDLFENVIHDLKSSSYSFYLHDTTTAARFQLSITIDNSPTLNSTLQQNTCNVNGNGAISAVTTTAGPWNFYWKNSEGIIIKSSLNRSFADSLTELNEGTYTVEINTVGTCDNATQSFVITNPPAALADFSLPSDTVTLVQGLVSVPFSNNSLNADTYFWDFGNGNTSGNINPVSIFDQEGTYNVSLTVSNSGCGDHTIIEKQIIIQSPALQITSSINEPLCININDGNIVATGNNGGPWDYTWYDGSNSIIKTSLAKMDPDTLYNLRSGVYSLHMKTAGASSETIETYYLNTPLFPVISFNADADTVYLSGGTAAINFTNTTINADSYYWDFGDTTYSQLSNPSHIYTSVGTHVVSLTAFNAACGDSLRAYTRVEVMAQAVGFPAFSASNNEVVLAQDAQGNAFIKFDYETNANVTISFYNILGAKVMNDVSLTTQSDLLKLDLKDLKDQLILVEIKAENKTTVTKKLVRF